MRTQTVERCRRREKEGQGGGAAECHPVTRESVLLVHRAPCLNRERNSGWNEPILIYFP